MEQMSREQRAERAALHTEWLQFFHYSLRVGRTTERAKQIADVLTYGTVQQ